MWDRWGYIGSEMSVRRVSFALAAAVLLSTAAGSAHAADKAKPFDFTVKSEPAAPIPNAGKTTAVDASKGRFGVTLNMQQPDVRPQGPGDFQAGAYFRITPSLRVGGSVALGEQDQQQLNRRMAPTPQDEQPKVRLETKFKF